MGRFNLASDFIILLFLLESSNLRLGENNALMHNQLFKGLQAVLEAGELVAQPDATDTAWRDKDALFAQFVACPDLAMCREVNGMLNSSLFREFIDAILWVGPALVLMQQGLNSAILDSLFIAIESVSGEPHNLAGFGYIPNEPLIYSPFPAILS